MRLRGRLAMAFAAVFGEAIADASPLARLINRNADKDDAGGHRRGVPGAEELLIGTTNLDMQRPVIWNIGAAIHRLPDLLVRLGTHRHN